MKIITTIQFTMHKQTNNNTKITRQHSGSRNTTQITYYNDDNKDNYVPYKRESK